MKIEEKKQIASIPHILGSCYQTSQLNQSSEFIKRVNTGQRSRSAYQSHWKAQNAIIWQYVEDGASKREWWRTMGCLDGGHLALWRSHRIHVIQMKFVSVCRYKSLTVGSTCWDKYTPTILASQSRCCSFPAGGSGVDRVYLLGSNPSGNTPRFPTIWNNRAPSLCQVTPPTVHASLIHTAL